MRVAKAFYAHAPRASTCSPLAVCGKGAGGVGLGGRRHPDLSRGRLSHIDSAVSGICSGFVSDLHEAKIQKAIVEMLRMKGWHA